ncbi:MAG: ATP-binding protein [Bdellovibrionales bacterium]
MPKRPDQILEVIERRESQSKRGRLRIFLGMCPGVGKTYSMLKAAREQLQRGIRVTVAVVETHGRKETEDLLQGLPVVPKKPIEYKGTNLFEMDLDTILAERPTLVLVDELAHTNAPGSRHQKRYQDIEELLDAGIDVYTTLNIQHIESRNDQVAQITGVQIRETVPDSFLENATQIELVDLPPEDLLHRLNEGKVYIADRAVAAAENFFKEEHLTALRELALRFTAEKVDQDLHDQMTIKGIEGPWNTNERLLVAISHSPYSSRLIRTTRRMAFNLEAPWVALYVDTGHSLSKEDQDTLQKNISLARELGAEVITLADPSIVHAIQTICADKNVTQIVMGRPDRRFFRDLVARGTLLDQLVRETSKIDVHVIRAMRKPLYRGFYLKWPELRSGFISYYNTAWFIAGASFFGYALLQYVGYRAIGPYFLLVILAVASVASPGPILLAATSSAIIWDFFFIPPQFTFYISSFEDAMMVISYFVTALVGGLLTSRIRRQEAVLQSREEKTRLLYEFVQRLSNSKTDLEINATLSDTVEKIFAGRCALFFIDRDGKIDWDKWFGKPLEENELAVARWSFENGKQAGWSTQTLSGSACFCTPLRGKAGIVGVLAYFPEKLDRSLSVDQEDFLETVLSQSAVAFERFRFSEAAQTAKLYEASEQLHQTLLNSVSHELRTPITALIGLATALKDDRTVNDQKARALVTDEMVRSAQRLDRVVENLLDLSRLQKGGLQLKKEWFEISDLADESVASLKDELVGRKINVLKKDAIVLEADFRLLSHSLIQLILNAAKYSPKEGNIDLEIFRDASRIRIMVRDEGGGIPSGQEAKIFDKFFRLPGTPTGGLGLGLTIASSIVELHGGKVLARNRTDKIGAVFEIELPYRVPPRELVEAMQ